MPDLNSEVKMHMVDPMFVGDKFRTDVWTSEKAGKELAGHVRKDSDGQFMRRLKRYSTNGFVNFEGNRNPIRREQDAVWRVRAGTLFRLIGFYEDATKTSFIVIDAFKKRGQKLSVAQQHRIREVVRVRSERRWRRR